LHRTRKGRVYRAKRQRARYETCTVPVRKESCWTRKSEAFAQDSKRRTATPLRVWREAPALAGSGDTNNITIVNLGTLTNALNTPVDKLLK